MAFIGEVGTSQPQFRQRYEGFRDALADVGIAVREPLFVPSSTRAGQGRGTIEAMIAADYHCDAVFCCCDAIALGAVEALGEAGRDVLTTFGVIGFDGLATGVHSNPPLTTIEPDFAHAGQILVSAALGQYLQCSDNGVPVRIIERGSVRR